MFLPVHRKVCAVCEMFQIGAVDLGYQYFMPCANNFQFVCVCVCVLNVTWSVSLRGKQKLQMFENYVLRKNIP